MRQLMAIAIAAMLATLSLPASATGVVTIYSATVRATAPGEDSASIQLNILSQRPAKIIGVASPVAGAAEMHLITHENGMMKMQAVESITLVPGKLQNLTNKGYHVMLLNLKQPLKVGDVVPFTVTVEFPFKVKDTVSGRAKVVPLTSTGQQSTPGMSGMSGM